MAAPLPKDVRIDIIEFLEMEDISKLSGREVAELVEENFGVHVSQPTALKLKYDAEDLQYETKVGISIQEPPMEFGEFRKSCREFFSNEGINILYEMAREGSNREKLEALKLIVQYGYGRPNNRPDKVSSNMMY